MTGSRERSDELLELTVPADGLAPRAARKAIGGLALLTGAVREDAILLTSELVANAIRHPQPLASAIDVRARRRGGSLRVEVSNRADVPSAGRNREGWDVAPVEPTASSGWGLRLVDMLARRWGTVHQEDRTVVWFEIDLRPSRTRAARG